MGELSFLTIIISLAVCSILVFAVYQYMKVRFTVLEHSQKEQALILQQYIEESSYDIQGLQSIVFRQRGGVGVQQQQQEQQAQMDTSEPEEVYEDHNKHIHMDTVMYEAPNKPRSTLIAISSDSENTTSDEDEDENSDSDGSESGSSSGSSSDDDGSSSDGEESGSESDDSEIESENVHMIHDIHEVKHIEISSTQDHHDNELEIESVTIIDEEPALAHEEPALETKTITIDLGTSVDTDEHQLASMTESYYASTASSAASSASSSVSFHGLSVIELRALLKEKYKGQHDKITNLQKLKKPELIQLLHE